MNIEAYTINAFAKTEDGGNPAGVVLGANGLCERQMREIAARMALSETAFVMDSDAADFKVRFFTPTDEVELCGHATIGTFALMAKKKLIPAGCYTQETLAGMLGLEVLGDETVVMDQPLPQFFESANKELIADSLNISADALSDEALPQIVSTGLRDIMVPVRSRALLNAIQPDFEKLAAVSKKYDAVGYHVFTRESLCGGDAYCRNFAPLYGIPEEAATGTSSGALACFLLRSGLIMPEPELSLRFEQGYSMGRPSEITVLLTVKASRVVRVRVGGGARNARARLIEL